MRTKIPCNANVFLARQQVFTDSDFVSCYIRAIYAPLVGLRISNQELLKIISSWFEGIQADDAEKTALFDFVRLLLIGNRHRYNQAGAEFLLVNGFAEHAAAFSRAIEESTSAIAAEILAQPPHQPFDAVFGVSSEGQLLPGIAERTAAKLPSLIGRTATQMDLGNGGCTASVRAIQLVQNLSAEFRNVLIVVAEPGSTLVDAKSTARSNWQGICTFSDGCARRLDFGRTGRWRRRARKVDFLERGRNRSHSLGLGKRLLSIRHRGT